MRLQVKGPLSFPRGHNNAWNQSPRSYAESTINTCRRIDYPHHLWKAYLNHSASFISRYYYAFQRIKGKTRDVYFFVLTFPFYNIFCLWTGTAELPITTIIMFNMSAQDTVNDLARWLKTMECLFCTEIKHRIQLP